MATFKHQQSLAPSFLALQLEQAINQGLQYAPATRIALKKFTGKSVTLAAIRPRFTLTIVIEESEVRVLSYWEGESSATIKGPLISILFQLGLNKSPGALIASGIQVDGDQQFAQQLADVFRDTDLDLEEPLSQWVGDVAAHHIGQAAKSAFGWLKKSASTLLSDTSHYLRDDSQQVIDTQELEEFSRNVDNTRSDFDRLEARVQQLRAAISNNQESTTKDTSSPQSGTLFPPNS